MKRFILSSALMVFVAVLCNNAFAYDFSAVCESGQTLYYNITSNEEPYTVEMTCRYSSSPYYYTFPTGELTIPSSVTYNGTTYSVTSIGGNAFRNCSELTSATIPNTITSIGDYAFYLCCELTSVTIPNSITSIGNYAFANCVGLSSLTIPDSVTSIGGSAFFRVKNVVYSGTATGSPWGALTVNGYIDGYLVYSDSTRTYLTGCSPEAISVTIPTSVTSMGDYAFSQCNELTSVYYTGSIEQWCGISFGIGEGNPLTCAHNLYIDNNLVTNLVIPETITEIKSYAFFGASCLRSVAIPNSVTSIGIYAFKNCSGLTSLTIPNSVTSIGGSAFENCSGLTSLTIGNSVTSIGSYAFSQCSGLPSLTIPNSVTYIGAYAFFQCSGLTGELIIPNSVTRIDSDAFDLCNGLTSVTIGNSITFIGTNAFCNCSGLTSVYYIGSIEQWCSIRFGNTASNPLFHAHNLYINNRLVTNLVIPETVTEIKSYAFYSATCLESVYFANSTTNTMSIGYCAFYGCRELTSVTMGNSVTSIGNCAFYDCIGMTSVTIGNSVTSIGNDAFSGCNGLTSVTIPNSVTNIGSKAFGYCRGLTSVNFNATNCTYMASGYGYNPAFYDCPSFTNLTIGEDVTTIPNKAFMNCTLLNSIISYAINPPVIYAETFDSQLSLNTLVVVPCGTVDAYEDAEFWNNLGHIQQNTNCGAIYTITVMSSNYEWGTVSGGGTYMSNEIATLTAMPNVGYAFLEWNDGNADNPRTVVVEDDTTYTATFAIAQHTITVLSDDENLGSVVGGGTYDYGTEIQIPATSNEHCRFVQWNDGNTDNPRTITVTSDSTFVANFASSSSDIQAKFYTDSNATAESGSSMTLLATEDFVVYPIIFNAGPNEAADTLTVDLLINGDSMLAGGAQSISLASQPLPVNRPVIIFPDDGALAFSADQMDLYGLIGTIEICFIANYSGNDPNTENNTVCITVTRQQQHTITVLANNEEYGTVTGGGTYDYGTEIQISATASEGYAFLSWNDGNTDNPRTVEVISDTTFVATFAVAHTIAIESSNSEMGYVNGSGVYAEGAVVEITAVPYEGYRFDHWVDVDNPLRDFNTDNPRMIVVSTDVTYMAVFSDVTSIEENVAQEISIFPNPTSNILNITSSEPISEIAIVNMMGQLVKRIEVNADNAACDVEDLKAGVYVVRIRAASATLSQRRFVKE
ncbi:MAG: leucine-rich repeat domain-containing protein [Bacteroidales bacterium]|nr:leucine-rich repeat domain-containing protein [Bacteroidales bacterium]